MAKFLFTIVIFTIIVHHGRGYMIGNNPHHLRETLDSEGKYQLEWLVDWNHKAITFHVTAATTGYVGFGLSSNGKMTGADIIIGGVDSKGRSYFADYHAVDHNIPVRDPSQNWQLLSAFENGTHTMISFSRAFDTCDPQDYIINEDKISLIWAVGTKDAIRYHHDNRGTFPVYILNADYSPQIIESARGVPRALDAHGNVDKSVKVWSIRREMTVPPVDTVYWCNMYQAPRIRGNVQRKGHITGFSVRHFNENSRAHLHHFIIFHCTPPRVGPSARSLFEPAIGGEGELCLLPDGPSALSMEYCTEIIYIGAIGGRPYFQPPHVGTPLESEGYYVLQVHLNNPTLVQDNRLDVSVDVFYTEELRQNEGGWLSVQHTVPGLSPSLLFPPDTRDHQIRGMCGSQCTTNMIPAEGVSVYGIFVHTHTTGRRARLRHFRNNRELPYIVANENYDSNYQQSLNFPKETRILPGDQFFSECVHDSTGVNRTTVGGFRTSQEMCAIHMFHYQKLVNIRVCESQIVSTEARRYFLAGVENITWSNDAIEYLVDAPHPLAGTPVSQISDNFVHWTKERREALRNMVQYHPHINTCLPERWTLPPGVTPNMFPGNEVTYPYGAKPYQPEPFCTPQHT